MPTASLGGWSPSRKWIASRSPISRDMMQEVGAQAHASGSAVEVEVDDPAIALVVLDVVEPPVMFGDIEPDIVDPRPRRDRQRKIDFRVGQIGAEHSPPAPDVALPSAFRRLPEDMGDDLEGVVRHPGRH